MCRTARCCRLGCQLAQASVGDILRAFERDYIRMTIIEHMPPARIQIRAVVGHVLVEEHDWLGLVRHG